MKTIKSKNQESISTVQNRSQPDHSSSESSGASDKSPGQPRKFLRIQIFEMACLTWLAMMIFLSMAIVSSTLDPLVIQRFPDLDWAASTFMMVHSIPSLLLVGILSGYFSDVLRRRYPLIVPSLMITGICTALLPHIDHFPTLLALRFVDGMTGIIAVGLIMARFLDMTAGLKSRGPVLGMFLFCVPMGYLLAMILTFFFGYLGVGILFPIVGVTLFVTAFTLLPFLGKPENISSTDQRVGAFIHSFKRIPVLWPALLFGFADKFTFAAIAMLTTLLMMDVFAVESTAAVSLALALYFSGFILFSYFAGLVTKVFGARRVILFGSSIYGVAFILLPHSSYEVFLGLMFLCGILTSFQFVPTYDLLGSLSLPVERGMNTQLFNFAGSLGFILGFPVLSILGKADPTYRLAYGMAGGMELLAVVIAGTAFWIRRKKSFKPADPAFHGTGESGISQTGTLGRSVS